MSNNDLPSDSDLSDEDYVPNVDDSDLPSEVDSDGDPEDIPVEEEIFNSKNRGIKRNKNLKQQKKKGKKKHKSNIDLEVKKEDVLSVPEGDKKKHEENLWADFLKDTGTVTKTRTQNGVSQNKTECLKKPTNSKKEQEKVTVTKIFDFAGEKVEVTEEVKCDSKESHEVSSLSTASGSLNNSTAVSKGRARGGTGFASVLGKLGKKNKISTLEKSKLDWNKFKKEEGIEEELETHNKGKDGYLERQDFLQRTDLRQFEIEKQLRSTSRRSNL